MSGNKKNNHYEWLLGEYKIKGDELDWVMKNGDGIQIKNMKDSHVKNCINMLRKKESNDTRRAWIIILDDVWMDRRAGKIHKIKNNILQKKQK